MKASNDLKVPDNPSVEITQQAWKAMKRASDKYGLTMSQLASGSICEVLEEFVVRDNSHEDQLELIEWLNDQ